ncbi:succinate dehydrogenase, hydrophobic membrane anchor protein [Tistrella sp. BH-R2-4]|uniref:Succinate dehydrogenase hydrophobic membrane anchor subunit n=2 Tax=Tistrella TaxID=171436 RepID=A0ABU9YGC6_9PROT|nr:succinate dehydrogenase, hydrophobic membrane anchor protein [Tistrella bauzanensis]GGB54901.1 succinate dehydrogenase, hydrophobic membrane anchor protein [Tistrella bauzanensis]
MSLRNPLARARGLGSAKEGVHHWWMQRVTAAAMVPLTLWFVISIIAHLGAGRLEIVGWLSSPVSAALMIAFLVALFWHAKLGLQVVIEDYVHNEAVKVASLTAMTFAVIIVGLACVVSVLKLAFGG